MKAWLVTDKHENTINIYHADTRGKLIQEVCDEHGLFWIDFFEGFTFKRCPEFDDREVTNLALLQSGLCSGVYCDNCNEECWEDDEEQFIAEPYVFCSKECLERFTHARNRNS